VSRPRASGLAQSVHDRLLERARREGATFAQLLETFAIERLLHRLGSSRHRESLVLKGAVLLRTWIPDEARFTRDVDLHAGPALAPDEVRRLVAEIVETEIEPDGLDLDAGSMRVEPIRAGNAVAGFCARLDVWLGRSRVDFQLDLGLGDSLFPPPVQIRSASLLGFPVAAVLGYSPYTAIAEKSEAILVLGDANSRMKDYFDLAELARRLGFEGGILREALARTLARRGTRVPEGIPVGLGEEFRTSALGVERWRAFVRKSGVGSPGLAWHDVVARVREFVLPPLAAVRDDRPLDLRWPAGGPWAAPDSGASEASGTVT